jgi:hypothetical protein
MAAAAMALGLHLAMGSLFVFQASPDFAQKEPGGSAIAVSLMRGSPAHAAPAPTDLDELRRHVTEDALAQAPAQDKPQHRSAPDLLKLFDAVASDAQPAGLAQSNGGSGGAEVVDPRALASELTAEAVDHTVLRPQVSRCWKPARGPVQVALLVRLDDAGNVVGPVVVFRRGPAASRGIASAEEQASKAVRDCAPYRLRSDQPRAFELIF